MRSHRYSSLVRLSLSHALCLGHERSGTPHCLYKRLERTAQRCKVQIFATDLDPQVIETARTGLYPEGIVVDVRPDRLARFFRKGAHSYRIAKEIRDMVIFAPHNILSDPPFTKLDFLSCRNLLISLDTALQKRLLPVLHYTLRPHGFLFLGTSETVRERLAEPLPMGTERILFVDDEEA